MPQRIPWDGRELITDVLKRFALREDFQAALDGGDRIRAVRILCAIGVDEESAWKMIAVLIPTKMNQPPSA